MIDWIIELSVGEKIALFSATVGVLGLLITVVKLLSKQRASQNIQGDAKKVAQVQGDHAKIDIK
tara:strand:- start:253 stop:444 length:192 start_codon:yes stop_codon:yes gene_type:complete